MNITNIYPPCPISEETSLSINKSICVFSTNSSSIYANAKRRQRTIENDKKTSYSICHKYIENTGFLSECQWNIENFKAFINLVKSETQKGDNRIIYIADFFERLDAATDIAPFIDMLASLGRQVFIDIGNYPIERFEKCTKVQIV